MRQPPDEFERYDFSPEEIAEMRVQMAATFAQFRHLESEKKERTHDLGTEMKRLRKFMDRLSQGIEQGYEMVPIDRQQDLDYGNDDKTPLSIKR